MYSLALVEALRSGRITVNEFVVYGVLAAMAGETGQALEVNSVILHALLSPGCGLTVLGIRRILKTLEAKGLISREFNADKPYTIALNHAPERSELRKGAKP